MNAEPVASVLALPRRSVPVASVAPSPSPVTSLEAYRDGRALALRLYRESAARGGEPVTRLLKTRASIEQGIEQGLSEAATLSGYNAGIGRVLRS